MPIVFLEWGIKPLVEKAAETVDQEDAKEMAKKLQKFDLDDLLSQIEDEKWVAFQYDEIRYELSNLSDKIPQNTNQ